MNVVALFPDRPRENGDLVFALHLVAAPPRSIVRPLHSLDAADAVAPVRLCTPLLYRDGSNFSRGGGGGKPRSKPRTDRARRLRLCTVVAMDEGAAASILWVPKSRGRAQS